MHEGDPLNFSYYIVNSLQAGKVINNIEAEKLNSYFDYYKAQYNNYLINRLADFILAKGMSFISKGSLYC